MTKTLLHHRKHILVGPAFGVEDPVRAKPRLSKAGREQVPPGKRPKHLAFPSRRDPGDEQAGG